MELLFSVIYYMGIELNATRRGRRTYDGSNFVVAEFGEFDQVEIIEQQVFHAAVEVPLWFLWREMLNCPHAQLSGNSNTHSFMKHPVVHLVTFGRSSTFDLLFDVCVITPVVCLGGGSLQGSAASLCVCPRSGWDEDRAAPQPRSASADRPTGCRVMQDVWVLKMNSCLQHGRNGFLVRKSFSSAMNIFIVSFSTSCREDHCEVTITHLTGVYRINPSIQQNWGQTCYRKNYRGNPETLH